MKELPLPTCRVVFPALPDRAAPDRNDRLPSEGNEQAEAEGSYPPRKRAGVWGRPPPEAAKALKL